MSNADRQTPNTGSPDPMQPYGKANRDKVDTTEPEQTLWTGGYSAKAMIGSWLLAIVGSIGVLVACFYLRDNTHLGLGNRIWAIGGGLILLWWIVAVGIYVYQRLNVSYELTNQRFIHRQGILIRKTDRMEVIDIDDVQFTQGIVQRMLGVGTITIMGSDRTDQTLILYGIDQVKDISDRIDTIRRNERRRRTVHVEQV